MTIGKNEVVEVLSDFRLRSIRFSAGPIYKPVATELLHRLSAIKPGDLVSGHFHKAFNAQERLDLLNVLRAPKPSG